MKKSLFLGNKKLAEFNLTDGYDVKVGENTETGKIKTAIVKRKESTAYER